MEGQRPERATNERTYIVVKFRDQHDLTAGFDYIGKIEADRTETAIDAAIRRENFRLGEVGEASGMYAAISERNFVPVEVTVSQDVSVKLQSTDVRPAQDRHEAASQ